jgi:hypothetical protein
MTVIVWSCMQQLACESTTQQQPLASGTSASTTSASPAPFDALKSSLSFVKSPWCDLSGTHQQSGQVKLCRIGSQPSVSTQPLLVIHTIIINDDCTRKLTLYGLEISPTCGVLSSIPEYLTACKLQEMVAKIEICQGTMMNPLLNWHGHARGSFYCLGGIEGRVTAQSSILLSS